MPRRCSNVTEARSRRATTQKVGSVELADGGTLFLDEMGEVPRALQPKLVRFVQDREFERLGGTRTIDEWHVRAALASDGGAQMLGISGSTLT